MLNLLSFLSLFPLFDPLYPLTRMKCPHRISAELLPVPLTPNHDSAARLGQQHRVTPAGTGPRSLERARKHSTRYALWLSVGNGGEERGENELPPKTTADSTIKTQAKTLVTFVFYFFCAMQSDKIINSTIVVSQQRKKVERENRS